MLMPVENNIINPNIKLNGKKRAAFEMNLQLKKLKAACKKHGCTVNDYITTVLSMTIHEYSK